MYVYNFLNMFSNKFDNIDIYVYNRDTNEFELEPIASGAIAEIIAGEYGYYDVVTYHETSKTLYIKG